jgi:superfamily II DNA/RNA helicase
MEPAQPHSRRRTDGRLRGNRRKLIIFTEPKDTLTTCSIKVRARLGNPDAVEVIHGGVSREERSKIVERFMQDRDMLVLIANDAAGEGVNLQRGHLMVNYDLPWNPNKIEQRFGRIHRIGQTEVCHLWNLVAADTREGEVYARLLEKLEAAREALGGRVYDVLGELFDGTALKDLLFEAIQYGEQEDVKARLFQAGRWCRRSGSICLICCAPGADQRHDAGAAKVQEMRIEMERAEAQRLQPHHIQSFFVEAFSISVARSSAGRRGGGRSPMSRSASANVTARSGPALRSRRSMNASASRRTRSTSSRWRPSSAQAIPAGSCDQHRPRTVRPPDETGRGHGR